MRDLSQVNLEDLKVAELKLELKKRNLPVSGPKPHLIERLKPYADVTTAPVGKSLPTSQGFSLQQMQGITFKLHQMPNNTLPVSTMQQVATATNNSQFSVANEDSNSLMVIATPPTSPSNDLLYSSGGPMSTNPNSPDNSMIDSQPASNKSSCGALSPSAPSLQSPQDSSPPQVSIAQTPLYISIQPSPAMSVTQVVSPPAGQNGKSLPKLQPRPPSVVPMDIDMAASNGDIAANTRMLQVISDPGIACEKTVEIKVVPGPLPLGGATVIANEGLLQQQQRKIEELERELKRSQVALRAQQIAVLRAQQSGAGATGRGGGGGAARDGGLLMQNLQMKQHLLSQQQQQLQELRTTRQQIHLVAPSGQQVAPPSQAPVMWPQRVVLTATSAGEPMLVPAVTTTTTRLDNKAALVSALNGVGHQRSLSLPLPLGGTPVNSISVGMPTQTTTGTVSASDEQTDTPTQPPPTQPPPNYGDAAKQFLKNKRRPYNDQHAHTVAAVA
ncbi:PREDICTED: MKL/myocardin-like protein 2 [Priapulus caudatus]|uniref:MKL/myocardin-like protein 2 n=1 Tax=Priapulus caudatus TaxID=37621 RepID=A0ABM1EBL0_PRICU|nr:PREDICTED: MKL/myocardin-like protein 2 [Priapulus caudatus]